MNDTDLENQIVDYIRQVIGPVDIADLVAYFPDVGEMRVRKLVWHLLHNNQLALATDMRLVARYGRVTPRELARLANAACEAAYEQRQSIDGTINWADLECVAAEWYEADDGTRGYRVFIEEADPAAYELQTFIAEWLIARGVEDVVVLTDW